MEEIAVIGLAGRFPGARNVDAFWENLKNGVESITHFPDDELELVSRDRTDSNFVKARGILDGVELFDASFFGIQPKEAELMDPQHRVFLECAWEALENAGYEPESYAGPIGVYAGLSLNTYLLYNLCSDRQAIERLISGHQLSAHPSLLGNDKDFLSTRVSHKLNLKGPSLTIQAACSTSLVAVCQACQSLQTYQCDMALAGGVSISLPQKRGYLYQEGAMVSSDGHCRAFDAAAEGTVFGAGVGIVVLKRLTEAIADRDNIYAVIKGYGLNNDGSGKLSFMAPSVSGQAEVILAAQAMAGVEADSISYIEAHGTGTPLGDPIEIAGLTQAFRTTTQAQGFCAIGSVKTNVGHLEAAAGVAGLIKTILALKHRQLPPSLHFRQPNPQIDFDHSPFYVNTRLSEWTCGQTPRRAGVSSFGVGGTNAHVVLEEAPPCEPPHPSRSWQLIALSARTGSALESTTSNLATYFAQRSETNIADAAYTLLWGRQAFNHRRVLVCRDLTDTVAALETRDSRRVFSEVLSHRDPPVVFMFPGQGAQHVNMGLDLYQRERTFKEAIDRCAESLFPHVGMDLRTVLYPAASKEMAAEQLLQQTQYAQPALFTVEYALARLWMEWGVRPEAMIGHSIGEYVASCIAGVFSLEDALELVAERSRLMQEQASGAMLAVKLAEQEVLPLLDRQLSIAAVNAPSLCVVAGPLPEVEALERELATRGVAHRRLRTSHAFHSAMMDPVMAPFAQVVQKKNLQLPTVPFITNVTGTWVTPAEVTDPHHWARHVRFKVRFADGLAELLKEPHRILLEVGPGQTLSTLARQSPARPSAQRVLASLPATGGKASETFSMLTALGNLWMAGVSVHWEGFYAQERRQRIPLPTYPFERERWWIDPPMAEAGKCATPEPMSPLLPVSAEAVTAGTSLHMQGPLTQLPAEHKRTDSILRMLKDLFKEVSGADLSDVDALASFLELGFDSLTLTQVSQAFKSKFGMQVSFRQLMEELCSLESLSAYVEEHMPPDLLPAEPLASPLGKASQSAAATGPIPPATLGKSLQADMARQTRELASAGTGDDCPPFAQGELQGGFVESVIKQQLEIMAQQMELLHQLHAGGGRLAGNASPTAASVPAVHQPATIMTQSAEAKTQRFGPFKPIERGSGGGLTPHQQQCLEDLIQRYNRKTGESKRLAQKHRAYFADPRAAGGFRQVWKEMVYPIVAARSSGSRIWDIDGNEYVDVTLGFGANLLGHSPPFVIRAVEEQLKLGVEIGPQSRLAGDVARMICDFTGMERVTFCNTGSEAVMAALRVARTFTGRNKIVFFSGDYHGIFDEVLSRPSTVLGKPGAAPIAPGIPAENLGHVMVLEFGSPASLQTLRDHLPEIAAVLIEPVQARHPDLQPKEFLQELRRMTEESETALIFDEVITGFRVHPGGAQAWFGIKADLATYGKVVGGGMPLGILAGKSTLMDALDGGMWRYGDNSYPEVGVTFFAGTFVRHPLAMAAAHAVLSHLKARGPSLQEELNEKTSRFVQTLNQYFEARQVPIRLQHFSSLFYYDFHPDLKHAALLFYYLRDKGVHIWEGRVGFLSTAHTSEDVDILVRAFKESIAEMQEAGFLPAAKVSCTASAPMAVSKGSTRDVDGHRNVPLTEAQKEMWLATQMGPAASAAYTESCTIHLHGRFDVGAMQQAVEVLVTRHEALRTTFSPAGDDQYFAPSMVVAVPFLDLSRLERSRRDAELENLLTEEGRKSFDLVNGPLYSFRIIRSEENYHLLVFTVHHIACDGWSYDIVLRELSSLYSSNVKSEKSSLPWPRQFSEYAQWEEEQKRSPEAAATEQFWLGQFTGALPVLNLPGDHPRPPARSYQGFRLEHVIDQRLGSEIKRTAAQHGCTLFAMLFAAFAVLLHRWSGQEDLIIGLPTAGQNALGSDDLIGHCANLLPIRSRLDSSQAFADFLKSVKCTLLDAYEHQGYTFGTLMQKLNLPRDPSRVPLVSVTFNLDPPLSRLHFEGLQCTITVNPRSHINFDLDLNIVEEGSALRVQCAYNADLFDAPTIQRLLGHYQTLVEGIVADPRQPLRALPLLTEGERKQLLVDWNNTRRDFPKDVMVHQLFEAQVERTPDALAVIYEDAHLTYAALNRKANQLAHYLLSLDVGPSRLVGIYMERCLDMVVALLAILKGGCAYVPLDPSYPKQRLEFMLQDAEMSVLLTQQSLLGGLSGQPSHTICLDTQWQEISRESDRNPAHRINPEDLAYVLYTSGSTGRPKGVEVTHGGLANYLQWSVEAYGIREGAGTLVQSPLVFDLTVTSLLGPLVAGNHVKLLGDGAGMEQLTETLKHASGLTLLKMTPSHLRAINALLNGQPDERAVRALVIGGEALLAADVEPWRRRAPATRLINEYGPTETVVGCCVYEVKDEETSAGIPIGRPIANVQVYVLDERMEPVPVGVPGELYIGGDGVARGYLNRPDLTAERFLPHPFSHQPGARVYKTGDCARYLPDGNLEFLGRLDQQVKIRGVRVELEEIEATLLQYNGIQAAVVVACADTSGAKQLVAYIVPTPQCTPSPSALRHFLQTTLPAYMLPAAFVVLAALPITPNGKVDRQCLPAPNWERPALESSFSPPQDHLEVELVRIWEQVLGVQPLGVDDNFFELGGHSLLAVRLLARIKQVCGRELPLAALFQAPTVAQLANLLHQEGWVAPPSLLVPYQARGSKPPFFCVHGGVGLAQHLGVDQPVYGLQGHGFDGRRAPATIEEMASDYLKQIQTIQPTGPYFLGGYSYGGIVVFEMAQQLHKQGQEVRLLILFDPTSLQQRTASGPTSPEQPTFFHKLAVIPAKIARHWRTLALLGWQEKLTYVRNIIRSRSYHRKRKAKKFLCNFYLDLGLAVPRRLREFYFLDVGVKAVMAYIPQPYAGRILLIKCEKRPDNPQVNWGKVAAKGLEIQEVPGTHPDIVLNPQIQKIIADLLKVHLHEAQVAQSGQ